MVWQNNASNLTDGSDAFLKIEKIIKNIKSVSKQEFLDSNILNSLGQFRQQTHAIIDNVARAQNFDIFVYPICAMNLADFKVCTFYRLCVFYYVKDEYEMESHDLKHVILECIKRNVLP